MLKAFEKKIRRYAIELRMIFINNGREEFSK